MSWAVFKYPITMALLGEVSVPMPHNAEILCVQMQRGQACVWARVNPAERTVARTFRWYPTGHIERETMPNGYPVYVGTVMELNDTLVFHLFVDPE